MEKKKLTLLLLGFTTAIAGGGCGRIYTGSYSGTSTLTENGQALAPTQTTISLNQSNGDVVTGTITGTNGLAGQIQGQASSGGTGLTSAYATITNLGTTNTSLGTLGMGAYGVYGYPSTITGTSAFSNVCSTFTGTINISPSNTMTGTLTSNSTSCMATITIQAQK